MQYPEGDNHHHRSRPGPAVLRKPEIRSVCCQKSASSIHEGYLLAYRYARAGLAVLVAISRMHSHRERAIAWSRPLKGAPKLIPQNWFGPYSASALRHLQRSFAAVVLRFTKGYQVSGGFRATQFMCLGEDHRKCRKGVLANASIYGTVRVCPSLLSRRADRIGVVVLHEMFHQLGDIRDQWDPVCRRGGESRCYGNGALRLVRYRKFNKALKNNDNLAQFAYFAERGSRGLSRKVAT